MVWGCASSRAPPWSPPASSHGRTSGIIAGVTIAQPSNTSASSAGPSRQTDGHRLVAEGAGTGGGAARVFDSFVACINCPIVPRRYLLSAEPQADDSQNPVRIAIGNGMRRDVWGEFQSRFGVGEVGEFYGSTEGNAALFNHCTSPRGQGAIGPSCSGGGGITKMGRVPRPSSGL